MKKVTWFFPLHPVPFYGQDYEKQKSLEVFTSLQKFLFWYGPLNLETVGRKGKNTKH